MAWERLHAFPRVYLRMVDERARWIGSQSAVNRQGGTAPQGGRVFSWVLTHLAGFPTFLRDIPPPRKKVGASWAASAIG